MNRNFSLAHLTVIDLPPPEVIKVAARCGYSQVGLRLMAVSDSSPGYPLMNNGQQLRETKAAMADTGVGVVDIEFIKITPELNITSLEPFFAVGAELGARHVITAPYDSDRGRLTEKLAGIAALCANYSLSPVLEFFPWTPVADLSSAVSIVEATGDDNVGVLLDTLHFARTASSLEELQRIPSARLPFVHVCDAPVQASYTDEELLHAARVERLPPGQGEIDIRGILNGMRADVPMTLEVPMTSLTSLRGAEFVARHVLEVARDYFYTVG